MNCFAVRAYSYCKIMAKIRFTTPTSLLCMRSDINVDGNLFAVYSNMCSKTLAISTVDDDGNDNILSGSWP